MPWFIPHSSVVFHDHCPYSVKFSSTDYKGAKGRECELIPREHTALTGKIVSTCSLNIVNRPCFSAWMFKILAWLRGCVIHRKEQVDQKIEDQCFESAAYLSACLIFFFGFFFFIVVVFVIHWHESALDIHVCPIPIMVPSFTVC